MAPMRARLTLCVLLMASPAMADEEEVEIRGTSAAGFVSRASMDKARREVTDAASLIEPLPGVHVRRLGADDSFATLSIRGSSSTQVAVYLAGVPLSGGADPTLDLATLPLWPGAHARVYRTFAPAALGRGSLGGALVLDPPSARSQPQTNIWSAVGSFGSTRLRIGDVRGNVATGFSASRSDDDFEFFDRSSQQFTERQNAGHAAVAGLASVALPIPKGSLTVTALAQARRQQLPGSIRQTTPYQRLDSSRLVTSVEATRSNFVLRAWGRREDLAITDRRPIYFGPTSTNDAIIAAGGSAGWRGRPTEDSKIEMRLDGSAERFAPGTWVNGSAPPQSRRANGGAAIDTSVRLAPATLAAAGRIDTWFDSSDDGKTSSEVRPTGNCGFEVPLGQVVVAAHGGFVARPPSFVERYGNRGAFLGNENLKSESAVTVDAGVRTHERIASLRVEAEVSTFTTWADDLIAFVYAGADGRAKATNIGGARLAGVEAEVRASGVLGFDTRVSYTGLTTANGSQCTYVTGRCERPALPGRPAHDFVADLGWTYGPLRVRYGIDLVAGIHTDLTASEEVPTRVLHSAGARFQVPSVRGLSLALDVRNLFDLRTAEYRGVLGTVRSPIGDVLDYPLPGRRILVAIQWISDR